MKYGVQSFSMSQLGPEPAAHVKTSKVDPAPTEDVLVG